MPNTFLNAWSTTIVQSRTAAVYMTARHTAQRSHTLLAGIEVLRHLHGNTLALEKHRFTQPLAF